MNQTAVQAFEREQMREDIPYFQPGDTVRVNLRVREGDKERIQAFEGVVIARTGGGIGETFTVRKISFGTGVERTFLFHSPRIESVKVQRRGRVRRAKLFYLRERVGKATRVRARRKRINKDWMENQSALPEVVLTPTAAESVAEEAQVEEAVAESSEAVEEAPAEEPKVEAAPAEEARAEEPAVEEKKEPDEEKK